MNRKEVPMDPWERAVSWMIRHDNEPIGTQFECSGLKIDMQCADHTARDLKDCVGCKAVEEFNNVPGEGEEFHTLDVVGKGQLVLRK